MRFFLLDIYFLCDFHIVVIIVTITSGITITFFIISIFIFFQLITSFDIIIIIFITINSIIITSLLQHYHYFSFLLLPFMYVYIYFFKTLWLFPNAQCKGIEILTLSHREKKSWMNHFWKSKGKSTYGTQANLTTVALAKLQVEVSINRKMTLYTQHRTVTVCRHRLTHNYVSIIQSLNAFAIPGDTCRE